MKDRAVAIAAVLLCSCAGPAMQDAHDGALVHRVDSLALAALESGPMAGLAIAVTRGGERLIDKGYGHADLENDVPVGPETVFRIGSITKQFTAAVVLELVEEGALGLDDPITRFLPDYPTHGEVITVRHLLTHSSGIFEYTDIEDFWFEYAPLPLDKDRMLALFRNRPLQFRPGTASSYNNSGYVLLSLIIESVTGEEFGQVLEDRFLGPLSMTGTRVCDARSIVLTPFDGEPTISYSGQTSGFCTWLAYYPEHDIHVTVLGNTRTEQVVEIGRLIGQWAIAGR